jgi:hypothetical protein
VPVLLVQEPVISLANEIIESDSIGNEDVSAKSGIRHHLNGLVVEAVAAHATRDDLFAKYDIREVERDKSDNLPPYVSGPD